MLPCDCSIFFYEVKINSLTKGVDGGIEEEVLGHEQLSEVINLYFNQP